MATKSNITLMKEAVKALSQPSNTKETVIFDTPTTSSIEPEKEEASKPTKQKEASLPLSNNKRKDKPSQQIAPTSSLIKSKKRVAEHGEVYTPENIVNDMLDLVKEECERLDATFLEPACGNGNFLVEILRRKLTKAHEIFEAGGNVNISEYDRNIFITVSSIYGVDILEDNIEQAKTRMLNLLESTYEHTTTRKIHAKLLSFLQEVLDANIIHGNFLTGYTEVEGSVSSIRIAEWALQEDTVTRKDYSYRDTNLHEIPENTGTKYPFPRSEI